jgi:hypothetical protein
MTNIFKAYATVQDKDFVRYIDDLKTQYEDGRLDMDADKLMMLGYQKFKNLNLHQTWEAPTQDDKNDVVALSTLSEELLALKTTIAGLKDQLAPNKGKKFDGDKWAWKDKAPTAGQAHTKQFNGKTYHYCPNHEKWCIHTPAECKGITKANSSGSTAPSRTISTTPTDDSDAASKRKLELTSAFNIFVGDSDDGYDAI